MLARRILPPPPTTGQRHRGWELAAGGGPSLPSSISGVSAWLRLAVSSQSAGNWTSFVDALGGASATASGTGPAVAVSTNGLPIATFTASVLQWPLSAANNGATKLGMGLWVKLANTTGGKELACIISTAGGASANKITYTANGTALRTDDAVADRHAVAGTLDTGWHFVTFEIDCTQGTEATQVLVSLDGVLQAISFSSDTAWSSSLGTPTGNMLIGAITTALSTPFVGSFGPNVYAFNRQLTAGERSALMNFEVPT